jgi:hypothetical protein
MTSLGPLNDSRHERRAISRDVSFGVSPELFGLHSWSSSVPKNLRGRGVEVDYMVKDDEGHGFLNLENQIDMYRAVERFLAGHLGGRAQEPQRSGLRLGSGGPS